MFFFWKLVLTILCSLHFHADFRINLLISLKKKKSLLRFWLGFSWIYRLSSQVVLVVKNPPASAGDLVRDSVLIPGVGRSPGETMTIHFSILAWRIPWTEVPGRLQSIGSHQTQLKRLDTCMDYFVENWHLNDIKFSDPFI